MLEDVDKDSPHAGRSLFRADPPATRLDSANFLQVCDYEARRELTVDGATGSLSLGRTDAAYLRFWGRQGEARGETGLQSQLASKFAGPVPVVLPGGRPAVWFRCWTSQTGGGRVRAGSRRRERGFVH